LVSLGKADASLWPVSQPEAGDQHQHSADHTKPAYQGQLKAGEQLPPN